MNIIEGIVNKIIDDLADRAGLGDVWESIDKDIKEEIKNAWTDIVDDGMSDYIAEMS